MIQHMHETTCTCGRQQRHQQPSWRQADQLELEKTFWESYLTMSATEAELRKAVYEVSEAGHLRGQQHGEAQLLAVRRARDLAVNDR